MANTPKRSRSGARQRASTPAGESTATGGRGTDSRDAVALAERRGARPRPGDGSAAREAAPQPEDGTGATVRGRVEARGGGTFAGHRVVLFFREVVEIAGESPAAPPALDADEPPAEPVPASASASLAPDGTFSIASPAFTAIREPIEIAVVAPTGVEIARRSLSAAVLTRPIRLVAEPQPPFPVRPSDDPALGQRVRLTGRVIDERGRAVPPGLPVVLWGVPAAEAGAPPDAPSPAPRALVLADTQTGGYFGADWPADVLARAFGTVLGRTPVPIPLVGDRLPTRVVLVIALPSDLGDQPCECETAPARAPEAADLTANPAAFSQDLGGRCVDLTTPNRVLEEFAYSFVVRTSEPEIKGVTLGGGGRKPLPPSVVGGLLDLASVELAPATRGPALPAPSPRALALDAATVKALVRTDEAPSLGAIHDAAYESEVRLVKSQLDRFVRQQAGRSVLDAAHAVDWDDTPTIYQATTVAHGHILDYRQVWRADGYSLGDLLYSLPLAPGQKRQVAVLDWERRATSAREESLEVEEQLDAMLSRDRDITEIVGSRLNEESRGGSRSTTWGVAGGIGAGLITGAFGIFGGVAGGAGGSSASAWQDNARTLSASTLQQLRDRTSQRASAAHDVRSTVVQTVAQGETVRAETEAVANYNRCHAMTIEYFAVLRHFLVTHELVGVRECLFVPLPITRFDRAKALRWREPLQRFLRARGLSSAFEAAERVARNWAGYDVPDSRFSEEAPEVLEGELRIGFLLPRPRDDKDGAFQVDMWRPYQGLLNVDALELWTAKLNARAQAERDRVFRTEVAPRIAERLVQRLRFAYVLRSGAEMSVPLDATLVSRYQESTPLYVTLRPAGALPPVAREEIARFKLWYDPGSPAGGAEPLPPDARVIVHSGRMRYRTAHLEHLLFDEPRLLNDLGATDAVVVGTPLSRTELRNPRHEDEQLADRLVKHLNEHLEFYHQAIWAVMDANRRYLLLDGVLAPNADGRSVASVVENRLIGIVGNCLVMPVAPGNRLDPTIDPAPPIDGDGGEPEPVDLLNLYATDPAPPIRISVPTRGVYAEAVMGACNSCEKIDDTRFWKWHEEPTTDVAPSIQPLSTDSRRVEEGDLKPTPLPQPIVNIQNAPQLPDPFGLRDAFRVLAKNDLFKDITGLEASQRNALAAFKGSLEVAKTLGGEAATLAKQNQMQRAADRTLDQIKRAEADGLLTHEEAQELAQSALGTLVGEPSAADRPAAPTTDPQVEKVIDAAAAADSGEVKVSTPTESLEARFSGGPTPTLVGSGPAKPKVDRLSFDLPVPYIDDKVQRDPRKDSPTKGKLMHARWTESRRFSTIKAFAATVLTSATRGQEFHLGAATIALNLVKPETPGSEFFVVPTNARVVFPESASKPGTIDGTGKLPLVVLLHGNHMAWDFTFANPTRTATRTGANGAQITVDVLDTVQSNTVVPNHDGFDYLQEELAKQGIVSVSVDTAFANMFDSWFDGRAETVLLLLDKLRDLSEKDAKSIYFNRLDFGKVGLIGHSRGGEAVLRVVQRNATRFDQFKFGFKAVCQIAPSDATSRVEVGTPLTALAKDVEFLLVLMGTHDADSHGSGGSVSTTGSGFSSYARATCQKAMVHLSRCCHNRFNTVWSGPRPFPSSGDEPDLPAGEIAQLRGFTEHQILAKDYAVPLFVWKLAGGPSPLPLYRGDRANSLSAPVALQWLAGSALERVDDFEGPKSLIGGGRTAGVGQIADLTQVKVPAATLDKTAAGPSADRIAPFVTHATKVLHVNATTPPGSGVAMTLAVPDPKKNWKAFSRLILSLAGTYDVSSDTKLASSPVPKVLVTLVDTANTSRQLPLSPATRPLFHQVNVAAKGKPPDLRNAVLFRFETVGVALAEFEKNGGPKLDIVKSLVIEIDPAIRTHVLVDDVVLVAL